jgi:hypothetical protein
MHATMGQLNVGQGGRTGLASLQGHVHTTDQQPVLDRPQAFRALWVARAHLVLPASWVGEITCSAHGLVFLSDPSLEADDFVGWSCFVEIQLITHFYDNSGSQCGGSAFKLITSCTHLSSPSRQIAPQNTGFFGLFLCF